MEANPITSVNVYPSYGANHATITWTVDSAFPGRSPYKFYVAKSPNGIDSWAPLNQIALVDMYQFTDLNVGMFDRDYSIFYRVTLVASDSGKQYHSRPQGVYGTLGKDDFLVAREIMRRQVTQLKFKGGVTAFILVRKKHGVRCPDCTHPVAGQVVAAQVCETCFGTGFVGGYHAPVLTMAMVMDQNVELKMEGQGLELSGIYGKQIQTIGFPILARGDIIVLSETDERCDIKTIKRNDIKSFPIMHSIGATVFPNSDIIYRVPLPSFQDLPSAFKL